jgi:hypothetical protein
MANSTATAHGEELSQHLLEAIHKLVHAGASHQAISITLGLKLEVVQQVLANYPVEAASDANYSEQNRLEADPSMSNERVMHSPKKKAKTSETFRKSSNYHTRDFQAPHDDILPVFIYSYKSYRNVLHWTNLATGEQSSLKLPSYMFGVGCCWSEVPGGSLLITGGEVVEVVVRIDTRREFAVSECAPMLTHRAYHAAVYHTQHLYVLGGWSVYTLSNLSECERYVCAENRWEALPPLPTACCDMSGVVVEKSLYALGGRIENSVLDLVQKLSLESLTWEVIQLRLPYACNLICCFKLSDTEVYFVICKTLYSFTAQEVRPLKTLRKGIHSFGGTSYYSRGTLYCSYYKGAARSYEIGSLGISD